MNKLVIPIIVVFVLVGGLLFVSSSNDTPNTTETEKIIATVYKSPDCGCCGVYAQYLKREEYEVVIKETDDMESIKEQFGVPSELQSCHTTVIGDYIVEGHIPSEAITQLLAEKPSVEGIALPGMPSGSPGMPGPKNGLFEISSFKNGGLLETFVAL
jgi:hypothetical protein